MAGQLYTFKVIAGEHQGKTRSYKAGEYFQSRYPLDEMFSGKFLRINTAPAPIDEVTPPGVAVMPMEGASPAPPKEPEFNVQDAVNVTKQFPDAKKAELSVYNDPENGGYIIAEAGVESRENLAGQVLRTKKAVNKFLKDFVSPEAAD